LFCIKGFAQSGYAVLVEESPVGAGEIKPGIGIHTFNINEKVTLTTIARPGWRFVYWLGDVSDPTANRTMFSVDGPKIIIAVFKRDEYELPGDSMTASSGPESLTRRADSISSGGFSGGGGGGGGDNPPSPPPEPPPEPVPEPQTLIIMAVGIYIGRRKGLLI
jgi:hypothetical protein